MRDTDILRYEVRVEIPARNEYERMYGKTKLICDENEFNSIDDAINFAKTYAARHVGDDVFILANWYTSEENVKRHFTLTSDYVWSVWYDEETIKNLCEIFHKYERRRP